MKFRENLSSGSKVIPCRRTDGQKDMKLIVAFRNFANMPADHYGLTDTRYSHNIFWKQTSIYPQCLKPESIVLPSTMVSNKIQGSLR